MLARRVLDLDFDEISRWFDQRKMKMPDQTFFPRVGFIVPQVACGFVYFTDSAVAIIDCYISNPESDDKDRDEALNSITENLIKMAAFHNIRMIKCDTKLDSIKKRAKAFGFKSVDHYESFILEL